MKRRSTTTDTRISDFAAHAEAIAFVRLLADGVLEIRSGKRPERVDDGPEGEVLAKLRFQSPAAVVQDGLAVLYPLDAEESAPESGTATWFRAYSSSGEPLWDGSVGVDDSATLRMPSTLIRRGGRVIILGATYRIEKG